MKLRSPRSLDDAPSAMLDAAEPPPSIFRRSTFDIDIETLDERPWFLGRPLPR